MLSVGNRDPTLGSKYTSRTSHFLYLERCIFVSPCGVLSGSTWRACRVGRSLEASVCQWVFSFFPRSTLLFPACRYGVVLQKRCWALARAIIGRTPQGCQGCPQFAGDRWSNSLPPQKLYQGILQCLLMMTCLTHEAAWRASQAQSHIIVWMLYGIEEPGSIACPLL